VRDSPGTYVAAQHVDANPPVHVLIVSRSFDAPGGVVSFVKSVFDHLPRGFAPHHLAIGRPTGRQNSWLSWTHTLTDAARLAVRILRRRPDCIHFNASFNRNSLLRDGLFILVTQALLFNRVLVFFHGWDVETERRIARSPVLRFLFLRSFGRAASICVLATRFRNSLVGLGVPTSRIHLCTTMFEGAQLGAARQHKPSPHHIILFMARVVREKGPFELVDAFASIANTFPSSRLTIAGDGPDLAALRAHVHQSGVSDRIDCLGYISGDEKVSALRDADIFALPSRHGEGRPVALMEAMAAGLCAIAVLRR